MKPAEYWRLRSEQLALKQFNKADEYLNSLAREYERATSSIQESIELFYARYAKENEVSLADARKMLSSAERKKFKLSLEEFIAKAKDNADGRWTKQLNTIYYRTRISRFEALQIQIRQQVEILTGSRQEGAQGLLGGVYSDTYYRTLYEIQKGTGVGVNFAKLNDESLQKVLGAEFAGNNWSKRIWGDRDKLTNEIYTKLSQSFIRGDDVHKASKDIAERMGVSYSNAKRLVQTETAFFAEQATMEGYRQSGIVDRFEFLATLDMRTSEICRGMDGKVFKVSEQEVGVNCPPLHVHCRSTTVPYFEDEEDLGNRIARDQEGDVYYVPGDIDYKKWYNQYIEATQLPKTIEVENTHLPRQLGFADDAGVMHFIPIETEISDVHIIGGSGVSIKHRAADRCAKDYGGDPKDWAKKVGKIESKQYIFDIHWVEHPQIGAREFKIAKKIKKVK